MPETVRNEIITSATEEAVSTVDKVNETSNTQKVTVSKTNAAAPEAADTTTTPSYDLNKFRLERILNNNTRNKSIALLGNFPHLSDSDRAIIIFEKQAFQESDVATSATLTGDASNGIEKNGNKLPEKKEGEVVETVPLTKPSYFCSDLKVQTEFINNIYGSYKCTPPADLNDVKATVVYPATDKHVEKYSINQKYLIRECPELYKEVTLPYIQSSQFSLEWVYNILEHKQETERIIFEDPDPENGFILLPDLKWNGRTVENLYVLAIVRKHGIKSLRDLNASHLPLLRNIRKLAVDTIEKRYGLVETQLRMYFHYQPSFYHLHIHINPVCNEAPGIWCEKSHMLDMVINNLELLPDFYERATLPCVLYNGNKLLELFEAKIPVKKAAAITASPAEAVEDDDEIMAKKRKIDETYSKDVLIESKTD